MGAFTIVDPSAWNALPQDSHLLKRSELVTLSISVLYLFSQPDFPSEFLSAIYIYIYILCREENNLLELILSFFHVSCRFWGSN